MAIEGGEVTIQSGDDNSAAEAAEAAKVNEAKAALYDEQQSAVEPDNGKILGKYNSVDELASAYKELQRAYNQRSATDAEEPEEPEEPEANDSEESEEEEEEDLSPGLTEAQVQDISKRMFSIAGGEDEYRNLQTWAASNIDEARKDAWNESLEKADVTGMEAQLKSFMWDMLQARGHEPKLGGGRTPTNEQKAFNSEAEVVEMMNDPRYRDPARRDPAFVAEVERRIAVSDVFQAS
jgi:hypothetical protein